MLRLHIWPGRWDLPSIDPQCIVAILFLQLTHPGRYVLVECSTPDLSPSGQLPFLTDGGTVISTVTSIIEYIARLHGDSNMKAGPLHKGSIDGGLSIEQRSKSVAWKAYCEAQVGDLILHSSYCMSPNYKGLTLPTLVSFMHPPRNYYVPGRLKEMAKPRLEAAGLWDLMADETNAVAKTISWSRDVVGAKDNAKDDLDKIRDTLDREKVLGKAKAAFDVLSTHVKSGLFVFSKHSPSSLDIYLAAHVLIILNTPLPNPLLKTLLLESYPSLVDHALLVRTYAFPADSAERPAPEIEPLADVSMATSAWLVMQGAWRTSQNLAASLRGAVSGLQHDLTSV